MKWPDLEKHERYGVAIMLTSGEISNCNGAFAGHLGTDVTGAVGSNLKDWVSGSCCERLSLRLQDLDDNKVGCASLDVTMLYDSRVHAIEMVRFKGPSGSLLWVVSFMVPGASASQAAHKLEALHERVLTYFLSGKNSPEVNINTTNITGDKNQSVQAEEVKDATQDN
jgi:hypothetical protein